MKMDSTRKHAFTLIELLIAVIIISILVAIIVPVYVSRANEARLTACQADLDGLKTAQEHAAIDTTYFYRLFVLDDVTNGDGIAPDNVNDVTDGIVDEQLRADGGGTPKNIYVSSINGQVLNGNAIWDRMVTQNGTVETSFNWNGPYVNVQRKYKPNEGVGRTPVGQPLDPWGNPYLLFTKLGLVAETVEPRGTIVETMSLGGSSFDCTVFDRPTILSMGPDGIPGSGGGTTFGQGDDLYRQF